MLFPLPLLSPSPSPSLPPSLVPKGQTSSHTTRGFPPPQFGGTLRFIVPPNLTSPPLLPVTTLHPCSVRLVIALVGASSGGNKWLVPCRAALDPCLSSVHHAQETDEGLPLTFHGADPGVRWGVYLRFEEASGYRSSWSWFTFIFILYFHA